MLQQILALAGKDLKVLLADRGGLTLLFFMPAMFILVMTFALGGLYGSGTAPLTLLVANEDTGPLGKEVAQSLQSTPGFRVEAEGGGTQLTRAAAAELIRSRQRNLAVVIPENFTQAIRAAAAGDSSAAQIELMADPVVSLQVLAPIRAAVLGLARQAVLNASLEARPTAPRAPIAILDTVASGMDRQVRPNVVQQNVPGWALFGVFFIAQTLAIRFLEERELGTLHRLMAAPLSSFALFVGKLIPGLIVNLAQITLMFAVGFLLVPLFGAPRLELGPHPEALVLVSVAASLAATSLGLLLASVATTREQIGALGSLLVVTMAALGGVMVPRFVMPDLMQRLSLVTPHAWALEGYLDVLVRGEAINGVLKDVAALLGFAVAFFAIAVRRIRLI